MDETRTKRQLVYLAHPLSGDWEANIADARLWAKAAFEAGFWPMAPYLMTEGILHEPEDREIGMEFDKALLAYCDQLWLCGPRVSSGMADEKAEAERFSMPVLQFTTPEAAKAYWLGEIGLFERVP
jgi:hypothetical protein